MKFACLFAYLLFGVTVAEGQVNKSPEYVRITVEEGRTEARTDEQGVLHLNVSPEDVLGFEARGSVRYSEIGAKGDGKTDDMDAIAATHAFANEQSLQVEADEGATYYIGGAERTAIIQTDTNFGTAAFVIDDRDVQNRNASVFKVISNLKPFEISGVSSLKKIRLR